MPKMQTFRSVINGLFGAKENMKIYADERLSKVALGAIIMIFAVGIFATMYIIMKLIVPLMIIGITGLYLYMKRKGK